MTVKVIGTVLSLHGRSCYEHHICGSLLSEHAIVHFRKLQILVVDEEESVIATYHVSDGIDAVLAFQRVSN